MADSSRGQPPRRRRSRLPAKRHSLLQLVALEEEDSAAEDTKDPEDSKDGKDSDSRQCVA